MKSKFILLCSIFAVWFVSCTHDELSMNNDDGLYDNQQAGLFSNNPEPLLPFAKALYSAMKESPELRNMIKSEAQERFNKEYELLYQFIKEEKVENGLSVRELLLKYFEKEENLSTIEAKHPTLTIHIPILPENTFSADIWNTIEQVPAVAIHPSEGFNPVIVSEKGQYVKNSDEFVIKSGHVPGFPVLVLKDNSRVVVSNNTSSRYPSLNNRNSDYVFDFIDDYFDGSVKDKEDETGLRAVSYWTSPKINQKTIDAYNIYGAYSGWQRDYILYNITPSVTSGTLSQNFKESILSFRFDPQRSPQSVCNYLMNSPSTDPQFPWTSGQFDFRVEAQLAAHNGAPPLITKYFSAYPLELFDVTFVKSGSTYIPTFHGFSPPLVPNVELLNWDLENYGLIMKISIWKCSLSGTATLSTSQTSSFVVNVKYYNKDGQETGSTSTTITDTSNYTITYQINDVPLGDALIAFGEPVIIGTQTVAGHTAYGLIDYPSGIYIINIIPVQEGY